MRNLCLIIGFTVATLSAGCSGSTSSNDAECEKMRSHPDAREAGKWLASGNHNIGEYSQAVSVAHVEDLYKSGAVSVMAVNIEKVEGDRQWTDMVVVELPALAQPRKALFRVEAELSRLTGEFEPEGDVGQKYMLLWYEASGSTPPGSSENTR